MSVHPSRLANYPQNGAASRDHVAQWLNILRRTIAETDDRRVAILQTADSVLAATTRETLAGSFVAALERLDLMERTADRYLTAYRSARQRSANDRAALVDADAERDALREELRTRDGDR